MPKWRTIRSAPKHADSIIVYDPNYSKSVTVAAWDHEEKSEGGQCWRDVGCDWDRLKPTHWMHFPDPPDFE